MFCHYFFLQNFLSSCNWHWNKHYLPVEIINKLTKTSRFSVHWWWWRWWWIVFVVYLISSRDHCQRSSPSRISDTPRAEFEFAQNLSSVLVEWSCAVVTTTTPRRHWFMQKHFYDIPSYYNNNLIVRSGRFEELEDKLCVYFSFRFRVVFRSLLYI